MRSRFLAIIALIGILAPVTGIAQAYLTPEEVLEQQKIDNAFLVPGGRRGARWSAELDAELSRQRHPSIIQEPWDPVQDDGLPPPMEITEEPVYEEPVVAPVNPYGAIDPVTARLMARLEQQNLLLQSVLQSTAAQKDAPLAGTGPAAVLSVMAMAGAVLWTLRRAKVMERFIGEF